MTWEKKRSTNITQKYKVASKFCSRYILLNVTYLELKLKAISTLVVQGRHKIDKSKYNTAVAKLFPIRQDAGWIERGQVSREMGK